MFIIKISDNELIADIINGLSVTEIAEKHEMTAQGVYQRLKQADITALIEFISLAEYINIAEQRKQAYKTITSLLQADNEYTRLQAAQFIVNRSDRLRQTIQADNDNITYSKLLRGDFTL